MDDAKRIKMQKEMKNIESIKYVGKSKKQNNKNPLVITCSVKKIKIHKNNRIAIGRMVKGVNVFWVTYIIRKENKDIVQLQMLLRMHK